MFRRYAMRWFAQMPVKPPVAYIAEHCVKPPLIILPGALDLILVVCVHAIQFDPSKLLGFDARQVDERLRRLRQCVYHVKINVGEYIIPHKIGCAVYYPRKIDFDEAIIDPQAVAHRRNIILSAPLHD